MNKYYYVIYTRIYLPVVDVVLSSLSLEMGQKKTRTA